jgi:hypothetical protein
MPRSLSKGSQGADVLALQQGLNLKNKGIAPRIGEDGAFGDETDGAVRAYQRRNKLGVDGIVGRETRKSIFNLAVATTTIFGLQLRPPTRPNLQDRVRRAFSPGQLQLGGSPPPPFTPKSNTIILPPDFFKPGFFKFEPLNFTPVKIPRLPLLIAAPPAPEPPPFLAPLPLPPLDPILPSTWKFDHQEVDPGSQVTLARGQRPQTAFTLTLQSIYARGPSDGKHLELATGVQFSAPVNANLNDGSNWTFNPIVQITDVDRLAALGGFFHFWQPYAQVGAQGSLGNDPKPALTLNLFPINVGVDVGKFLTLTFGAGAAATLDLETMRLMFSGLFTFGANIKLGGPD